MTWLASFPRSGNTFLRNILYEVYGLSSGSFPLEDNLDKTMNFPFIKTHFPPSWLPEKQLQFKSIYLVRDGRDALISLAHHRKNIIAPKSDYYNNLLEAIIAPGGSHFGGWSENVKQWSVKADLIIRFEDLISNPIQEVEKIRKIMNLPKPDFSKLPDFKSQKFGSPKYSPKKGQQINKLFFRKGKSGNWKDEMPEDLHQLFWEVHGDTMDKMGYSEDKISPKKKHFRVLIDATKLKHPKNDGVKRYLEELVGALRFVNGANVQKSFSVDLFLGWGIIMNLNPKPIAGQAVKPKKIYQLFKKLLTLRRVLDTFSSGKVGLWMGKIYYQSPFPILFKQIHQRLGDTPSPKKLKAYDLIHIPLPQHLEFYKKTNTPILVTAHDFTHKLFPDFHEAENIRLSEKGIQLAKEKKAHFIAVSNSTKRDLTKHYNIFANKIDVIHEAVNGNFFKSNLQKKDFENVKLKYALSDCPYFLCLSTIEPRKNLSNTIKAFEQIKLKNNEPIALVICGAKGWKYEEVFEELKNSKNPIHFTGYVEDEHLPILYSNAIALCYVSHYEGFGLLLLEAMSCGTPVIFGNNSSMLEVVGEGGLPADSNDVNDIKMKMERMIFDRKLRQDLAQKAIIQSYKFSWLKAAFETLKTYEEVISSNTHAAPNP